MKIKRFVAPDMRTAIRQVREDQGPDAVILSNRSINGGIEIIAAVDYDEALVNHAIGSSARYGADRRDDEPMNEGPNPSGRRKSVAPSYAELAASYHAEPPEEEDERSWLAGSAEEDEPFQESPRPASVEPSSVKTGARRSRPIPDNPYGGQYEDDDFDVPRERGQDNARIVWSQEPNLMEVRRELSSVRNMLQSQFSNLAWDRLSRERPIKATVLRELSAMGIEPDLARQILEEMPATEDEQQAWRLPLGMLARRVPVGNDPILEKGGRIALVGPTGVGKTTTIAKLAARFALRHGKRHVALISTDHYRVGGQEQLHSYGRILGVPVFSVDTAEELRETLLELDNKKLVLVDSAGMSQRDSRIPVQMDMLRRVEGQALSVNLVLSADSPAPTMEETVRAYADVGLDGCILTKLDEATGLGGALSVAVRHALPIGYITDGQRVPEDIQPARSHRLVSRAVQLQRRWPGQVDENELAARFGQVAAQTMA
ncbi:flagellar biosynthesis protein FlhF [Natronospira proteinivora]|uniref:Flagellar biosynthesis protein FlhF n=1 Tax=Natronospira proteinivora TaxID=1807133 RepID=A0ABT1G597_9GAMM|nr:flagellar biosynthesis protein FlhF [Natronospira proteinivora]MCP1726451.1 flagellar biosynthesis protein FlhF [Natronospira proteinivora]